MNKIHIKSTKKTIKPSKKWVQNNKTTTKTIENHYVDWDKESKDRNT